MITINEVEPTRKRPKATAGNPMRTESAPNKSVIAVAVEEISIEKLPDIFQFLCALYLQYLSIMLGGVCTM